MDRSARQAIVLNWRLVNRFIAELIPVNAKPMVQPLRQTVIGAAVKGPTNVQTVNRPNLKGPDNPLAHEQAAPRLAQNADWVMYHTFRPVTQAGMRTDLPAEATVWIKLN